MKTAFSTAPLCLCCTDAPAEPVCGDTLFDTDLQVPVCVDCAKLLDKARRFLLTIPGIRGCAALGPDSGKGVQP